MTYRRGGLHAQHAKECYIMFPVPLLNLSYSSKINCCLVFISSESFSTLEKNALICYQRAMLPIQSGVTADSNGSLAPFLFEFKLSGLGVTALC